MVEAIEQQLDEREAAFVEAYLTLGGLDASKAAIAAGYSPNGAKVQGHRLLKRDRIRAAIRAEAERRLQGGVALAADVLLDLAQNAKAEAVRRQAAKDLLDYGGLAVVARSEHTLNIVDKRTDAELREQVARLTRELGLGAVVIDGTAAPTPGSLPAPVRRPVVDVLDAEAPGAAGAGDAPTAPPQPDDGLPDLFD